jgi:hypothetical protein
MTDDHRVLRSTRLWLHVRRGVGVVLERVLGRSLHPFGGLVCLIRAVLLVLDQQPQRFGGLGQNPERAGPPRSQWIDITAGGQYLSDPAHRRQEPDRIACRRLRHHRLQANLGIETEDVLRSAGPLGPLRGQRRISFEDRRRQDRGERGHGIIPTKSLRA